MRKEAKQFETKKKPKYSIFFMPTDFSIITSIANCWDGKQRDWVHHHHESVSLLNFRFTII